MLIPRDGGMMAATTRRTLLLAILLVGFGCGEQGFPESTGAELKILGTGPNGELSFGDVEPGTSKTKTIVIKNEGDHPLKLDELKLGPNPHFSLEVVGSLEGAGGGG
jgi:hypothetical protein